MKTLLSTTFLFLVLNISAQHQIGHISKTFVDASRNNRAIESEIYYPAVTAGNNTPAVQNQFPVIVFGHGFVMSWEAYQNIWEELVPQGYILVFPRTEGNALSTNHQKFGWDLQFLVTEMQTEGALSTSLLYNVVHPNTALMGHSMGGGACFLAADSLCMNGNINLKTLVGLAPAESSSNGVSSIASASNVTVPSVIFSGVQDGVAPPAVHHIPMYNALASSCKTILHITGGAHCYFANTNFACDFGEGTSSTGISISRSEQQQILYDFVTPWLEYTLKSSCGSFQIFQDSVANSTRISFDQVCASLPSIDVTISATSTTLTSNQQSATSYQWVDCDNSNAPIALETNQSFSPSTSGNYAVEITLNGCTEFSNCIQFTNLNASLSNLNNNKLSVYPNPTKDNITIKFQGSNECHAILYDLQGKTLTNTVIKNGAQIDISEIEKGTYFLHLTSETINSIHSVVKQ